MNQTKVIEQFVHFYKCRNQCWIFSKGRPQTAQLKTLALNKGQHGSSQRVDMTVRAQPAIHSASMHRRPSRSFCGFIIMLNCSRPLSQLMWSSKAVQQIFRSSGKILCQNLLHAMVVQTVSKSHPASLEIQCDQASLSNCPVFGATFFS